MPEINPATGCYCTFAQHMLGDGCSICNPRYVDDLPEETEEETGAAELKEEVE